MRVHYNFYPGRSADGMSIDTQGNLYASAGLNQLRGTSETLDTKGGVHVISPQGKLLKFIPIPEDTITNNAFGGPDMKTLYMTAGKTLYKVRTGRCRLAAVGTRDTAAATSPIPHCSPVRRQGNAPATCERSELVREVAVCEDLAGTVLARVDRHGLKGSTRIGIETTDWRRSPNRGIPM